MSYFTLYYQNARSIRGKLHDLYLSSLNIDYDIIIITETWLNESVLDAEILNKNYSIYRRDRCSTSSQKSDGGGVLVAVSRKFNSLRKTTLESYNEDLWVQISGRSGKSSFELYICAVYLPPPVSCERLQSHLDYISDAVSSVNKCDMTIIVGDFNVGSICWGPDLSSVPSSTTILNTNPTILESTLSDFMSLHNFKQFNLVKNKDGKILDIVLSNSLVRAELADPLSVVDPYHPPLLISVELPAVNYIEKINTTKSNFFAADYNIINEELISIDWDLSLKQTGGVDNMVKQLYSSLEGIIDKHVPLVVGNKNQYPVWYSRELIKLIKKKGKTTPSI